MIIEALIKVICNIVKLLFSIVKPIFNEIGINFPLADALTIIIGTTTQANNFIHFMLGDTANVVIPSIILLTTYKYVAYPIVTTLLGLVINKTS